MSATPPRPLGTPTQPSHNGTADALHSSPPADAPERIDVLLTLGRRARQRRQQRGLTLRALADRSGLSLRFLMDVEAGRGNISVRRLSELAAALQTSPADLVTIDTAPAPRRIALLGLRGSGKTTIGRRLARRLRLPFVELDQRVEEIAGLSLDEVFSLHGEDYYRQIERDALIELLTGPQSAVIAVGGGLVTAPETYGLLRRMSKTIWLKAREEDYWNRVVTQGDRRPMDQHPQARQALRDLVARREPLYARADITIDTSGLSVAEAVERVEEALK